MEKLPLPQEITALLLIALLLLVVILVGSAFGVW